MPLLTLCACLALQQAAIARGSVFEDLDGDGARAAALDELGAEHRGHAVLEVSAP